MKFPDISDVATTEVVKVGHDVSLEDAIEQMYQHNHRNVVVEGDKDYYILTASDLLHYKLKEYDFSKSIKDLNLTAMQQINKHDNILDTIEYLDNNVEYICAVNDDGTLYGILTHTDIVTNIDPETLMENYRIGDLINMNKDIHKVSTDAITADVLKDMADQNYDCVVIKQNKEPLGIITTKDIMKLLKNKSDLSKPVSTYMSSPIETLNGGASIKKALKFMKEKHYKRILVTNDDGKLIGLILQKELITLSYSKWSMLMKQYSNELSQINSLLQKKNQKYEKMATSDALTGLYNRYKFTELFVSEYDTMTKRKNAMSLIILDIDHFKSINDTYGHNIGDKVLLEISNILLRYLRNVDIVGRWGGEEFVALLPTATLENGVKLAHKIKDAIENTKMINEISITASFGITQVRIGDQLSDTIKRADEALYEAKRSGRNCVKTI